MKFDYFYGGHVAMDDLGFVGRPVDERIEADEHLASVFAEARAMAQLMDAAGYDTLWLAEHHFQREGAWLCGPPEYVAVRLAEIQAQLPGLERVTIGAGVLGIPPEAIRQTIEWFGRDVLSQFEEAS